jgi:plastocyanin domain-containing protein
MSLFSFNGVLEVLDFPITGNKIAAGWVSFWTPDPIKAQQAGGTVAKNGVQAVTIDILNNGYSPRYIRVKKGVPVQLTLRSNKVYSCALSFNLKAFGIREFLNSTDQKTLSFTPDLPGKYQYTCSMGMYTGVLEVI